MNVQRKNVAKSVTLGLLASFSIYISNILNIPAWVLYIGWSSYGLFCNNFKEIFPTIYQETLGMLSAFLIHILGLFLESYFPKSGILISVFIIVAMLFWVTKLKRFNNLIAYFLGLTAWFSFQSQDPVDLAVLTFSLFLGFVFGYVYSYLDKLISIYKSQ